MSTPSRKPRAKAPAKRVRLKPIDQCTTVAQLLGGPSRWTQDVMACTRCGYDREPTDDGAERWCLSGALVRVYQDDNARLKASLRLRRAIKLGPREQLIHWNDDCDRTHRQVLAAVRRAGV